MTDKRRLGAVIVAVLTAVLAGSCAPGVPVDASSDVPVATRIVVHKQAHRMIVYRGSKPLREFKVALGHGGLAPKERQGDGRVPEGTYLIDGRNPNSAFHLSLHISYPTPEQVRAAAALGFHPGGDIMIHGLPNGRAAVGQSFQFADWTDGCIAVTNSDIEWLWRSVADGTPIRILP